MALFGGSSSDSTSVVTTQANEQDNTGKYSSSGGVNFDLSNIGRSASIRVNQRGITSSDAVEILHAATSPQNLLISSLSKQLESAGEIAQTAAGTRTETGQLIKTITLIVGFLGVIYAFKK